MPGSESRELDLKQSGACDLRQNSLLPCPTPSFLMLVWGHCKALKSKRHFRREDKAHNLVLRWSNGWKWEQRKDGVELLYFYMSESPMNTETWNMCLLPQLKHKMKSTPQMSLTLQWQALANQVGLQTHWGSAQEDTLKIQRTVLLWLPDLHTMNSLDRKHRRVHARLSRTTPAEGCSPHPKPGEEWQLFSQGSARGWHFINKATSTKKRWLTILDCAV